VEQKYIFNLSKNTQPTTKMYLRILLLSFFIILQATGFAQVNPKNITIVRDSFGVPHIHGKTDAEAAYGLAWAHSEDNFKDIQEN